LIASLTTLRAVDTTMSTPVQRSPMPLSFLEP